MRIFTYIVVNCGELFQVEGSYVETLSRAYTNIIYNELDVVHGSIIVSISDDNDIHVFHNPGVGLRTVSVWTQTPETKS